MLIRNLEDEDELYSLCYRNPNICFIWVLDPRLAPSPLMEIVHCANIDFDKFNSKCRKLIEDKLKDIERNSFEEAVLMHEIDGYHKMWIDYIRNSGIKYIVEIDKGWT